jgi:hypothetical protein
VGDEVIGAGSVEDEVSMAVVEGFSPVGVDETSICEEVSGNVVIKTSVFVVGNFDLLVGADT